MRAHAHIDTKRREPYLLDDPYKGIVRDILRLRYSMLPVWYTAFREASVTGLPVLRPHFVAFPQDERGFSLDDQYFVGSSGLLVKPVTRKGVTEETVYLPAEDQVSQFCMTLNVLVLMVVRPGLLRLLQQQRVPQRVQGQGNHRSR